MHCLLESRLIAVLYRCKNALLGSSKSHKVVIGPCRVCWRVNMVLFSPVKLAAGVVEVAMPVIPVVPPTVVRSVPIAPQSCRVNVNNRIITTIPIEVDVRLQWISVDEPFQPGIVVAGAVVVETGGEVERAAGV